MFPDPSLRFKHFPSLADGHFSSPYVEFRETSDQDVLLEIINNPRGDFRIMIRVDCWLFIAIEEFRYSVGGHGDPGEWGTRTGYIQEATDSAMLRMAQSFEEYGFHERPRHFIFVGGNHCVETVGYSEPHIQILPLSETTRTPR